MTCFRGDRYHNANQEKTTTTYGREWQRIKKEMKKSDQTVLFYNLLVVRMHTLFCLFAVDFQKTVPVKKKRKRKQRFFVVVVVSLWKEHETSALIIKKEISRVIG